MENKTIKVDTDKNDVVGVFLEQMLNQVVTDTMMHDIKALPNDTHKLYNDLATGNIEHALELSKDAYFMHVYQKLISDYFSKLSFSETKPNQLAVCLSHSKLLIWAEISDDDEKLENQLILLQAEMNVKYEKNGLIVKTTIVEESDNFEIPNHYSMVPLKN